MLKHFVRYGSCFVALAATLAAGCTEDEDVASNANAAAPAGHGAGHGEARSVLARGTIESMSVRRRPLQPERPAARGVT